MARPREFELDAAIASAMNVFWAHGYEETSLPQLLDGMSLSRGSFYKAFIDKRSLFFAALNMYETEVVLPAIELLTDPTIPDGSERIKMLFKSILDAVNNGDQRGCLLCTAAAGSAPSDSEVAIVVHKMLGKMKKGFEIALEQSPNFIGQDAEAKSLVANLLLNQYVGLRVLARSRASVGMLEQTVASIKYILTSHVRAKT